MVVAKIKMATKWRPDQKKVKCYTVEKTSQKNGKALIHRKYPDEGNNLVGKCKKTL